MAYTVFAQYCIMFRNQADYQFAIDLNGGNYALSMAPRTAAAIFGVPFPYPTGSIDTVPIYIIFPGGFNPGTEIMHPGPTGLFYDDTLDEQFVPGQTVHGGGPSPSPDMILKWSGALLRAGGFAEAEDPTPIPQRRWIGGIEFEPTAEGGGLSVNVSCREASRTVEGVGLAIRGDNTVWSRSLNTLIPGYTSTQSWERFYFRPRVPGATNAGIWRCHNSVSANAGIGLKYSTGGDILVYNIDAINTETLIFTVAASTIPAFRWVKVDILICYPTGLPGSNGGVFLFINGVLVFSTVDSSGNGIGQTGNHVSSELGKWTGAADAVVQYDLDDWINADWPSKTGVPHQADTDGVDFLTGSHVRRVNILSGTFSNFTPANYQIMNQGHNPLQNAGTSFLGSSTALATVEGLSNVPTLDIDTLLQDFTGVSIGNVAAIIFLAGVNTGGTDGRLGYRIAGGVAVMATIDQTAVFEWKQVIYRPSGLIVPGEIAPFSVKHEKSNDANFSTADSISASIEQIGAWGPEDIAEIPEIQRDFLHNCRYPNTPWGAPVGPFDGPAFSVGGTYVGNGLGTVITLPAPCHMLVIRRLSGVGAPVFWFGASLGGHLGTTDRVVPNFVTRMYADDFGDIKFEVSGTDANVNAAAATYQYIAFCDPGARFSFCGSYRRPTSLTTSAIALADSLFLAGCAFVQNEILNTNSNNQGLSFKGPGSSGNTGNFLNGAAAIANWGTLSQGFLNTRQDIHNGDAQNNFILFRSNDTSCGYVFAQIGSYTGDGTASRVINLSPTSGRFPLLVIVIPTNNTVAIMRDPSHTGANSCQVSDLTNTVTGITAGAKDQITVGISLNANGIVYNYFVIPGSDTSWSNGEFNPGNCGPPGDEWEPPNEDIPEIAVAGDGGVLLGVEVAMTILKDVSGLYTLVPGKTNDTIYNRISGASTEVRKIPDIAGRSGFIGG